MGPGPDGRPKYVSRTWKNLVEGGVQPGGQRRAEAALAKFVAEVEDGWRPALGTVGELLDRWLAHITPTRSPHTIRAYKSSIERAIRPALGSLPLAGLTPLTLDTWYGRWLDQGLSPSTVRQYHAILPAALHQAVKWEVIDRSPPPEPVPRRPAGGRPPPQPSRTSGNRSGGRT